MTVSMVFTPGKVLINDILRRCKLLHKKYLIHDAKSEMQCFVFIIYISLMIGKKAKNLIRLMNPFLIHNKTISVNICL